MIVSLAIRCYVAACDLCERRCPVPPESSSRAARKAANTVGWRKHGRTRACPDCAEANHLGRS